jgi:hypothetical protein
MRTQLIGYQCPERNLDVTLCVKCATDRGMTQERYRLFSDVDAPHGLNCETCGDIVKPSVLCRTCLDTTASVETTPELRAQGFCSPKCARRGASEAQRTQALYDALNQRVAVAYAPDAPRRRASNAPAAS